MATDVGAADMCVWRCRKCEARDEHGSVSTPTARGVNTVTIDLFFLSRVTVLVDV